MQWPCPSSLPGAPLLAKGREMGGWSDNPSAPCVSVGAFWPGKGMKDWPWQMGKGGTAPQKQLLAKSHFATSELSPYFREKRS